MAISLDGDLINTNQIKTAKLDREKIIPNKEAILNGLTENPVAIWNHRLNNL